MRLPHSTPRNVPSIVGCGGAVAVAWPWHVYEMPWVSTRPAAARDSHRRCGCSATAKLPSLVGDVKSIALSAPHSHRSLPSLAPIAPPRTFNAPSLAPSLSHTHVRARARVQSTPRTSPGVDATRATQRHAATSAGPNASAFAGKKRRKKKRKKRKRRGRRRDEEGDGERMGEVFDEEETTEGERGRVGEGSHPAVCVCCVCCVGGGVCSVLNVSSSATSHIPPHIK